MLSTDTTFRGEPVALSGHEVHHGDLAPDFTVRFGPNDSITFEAYRHDRVVVVGSLPSLTIATCAEQVRVLDAEIPRFIGDEDIPVLFVTSDGPEVVRDFAERYDLSHIALASDYRDGLFGERFGVKMGDSGLLGRSAFVIDHDGRVAYREIVAEALDEPDYYRAFKSALMVLPR